MKLSSLQLLFAAACLLFSFGLRAQTHTLGNLTTVSVVVFNHDSTTCSSSFTLNYNVTVNTSFLGDSLTIIDTFTHTLQYTAHNTTGASPWTFTTPGGDYIGGYADWYIYSDTIHYMGPTNKIISGSDTMYVADRYAYYVPNHCSYSSILGRVYSDMNGNCIYDAGDVDLSNIQIYHDDSFTSIPAYGGAGALTTSSATGEYGMMAQQSWLHNYSVRLLPQYAFIFPYSPCFAGSYSFTTLPQSNVDFPLQCSSLVDAECGASAPANARPNRPFYLHPYVSNIGCDSVSGTLTLIKDSRVAYDAALSSNPATSVSGDTLRWYYYNLTNISGGAYWNNFMSSLHLTPNTSVNIGDTLCFHLYTGVPAADVNPANNDYTLCLPVVNSYDPNIKEVSPKGIGADGNIPPTTPDLTYTIHFQNTGTDVAYNVSIIDTLDSDVDATSLKILGTSHTMTPEWLAPGIVKFNFTNIFLADSFHNEPASHGSVKFTVKMHSGLPLGRQIKNKGYIYFDYNPAVITNEALNTISWPTGISTTTISLVQVYPNPASDAIYVENLQDGNISILSMNGSVVLNQNITNNKTEINIDRLSAGIYILKTVSKDGATTRKFVKQ